MGDKDTCSASLDSELVGYRGRWVAFLNGKVIGQGGTPDQAFKAAKQSRYKETPKIIYIPMNEALIFHPILNKITPLLPDEQEMYIVGGAIRDALLKLPMRDLDIVVTRDSLQIAKTLADKIRVPYFPLDEERDTARLVLDESSGGRIYLDFSTLRGDSLESDLKARDFTINAMAVNIRDRQKIFDPLSGAADLLSHQLRVCSPSSFQDDPVRILRAIRLAGEYELKITAETRSLMHASIAQLSDISAERMRDELFRILTGIQPARSIRALDILNALPYIFPELPELKGVDQSPPHVTDVWEHTLDVLKRLEIVLDVLSGSYEPDKAANLLSGMAVMRLGRYRQGISEHLVRRINVDRPLRGLLFFAALYHDVGKPRSTQKGEDGCIHFYDHEKIGAKLAAQRARELRLSNIEIERISKIIRNHMRPLLLAQLEKPPTRRAIYRFYRDTDTAGVDICLLALADTLATYGPGMPPDKWLRLIDVIRTLFEAWWERPEEYVRLPSLISGGELLEEFNLTPGPLIGELLDAVREAQVNGLVQTHEESLDYIKNFLKEKFKDNPRQNNSSDTQ